MKTDKNARSQTIWHSAADMAAGYQKMSTVFLQLFRDERGSCSHLTVPKQSSIGNETRPPFLGDLGSLVLFRNRVRLACSHSSTVPKQGGNRSLFRNKFSKRDRCESDLKHDLFSLLSVSWM